MTSSLYSQIFLLFGHFNFTRNTLQTLSIDNAWFNKNSLCYLTFRMLQHTPSEVSGYNCYKNTKIMRGTGDKIIDTTSGN